MPKYYTGKLMTKSGSRTFVAVLKQVNINDKIDLVLDDSGLLWAGFEAAEEHPDD